MLNFKLEARLKLRKIKLLNFYNNFKFLFVIFLCLFLTLPSCLGIDKREHAAQVYFKALPSNFKISSLKGIFFIYIAADNNLSEYAKYDLQEILEGSKKNPNVAYFVFVDTAIKNDSRLGLIINGNAYLIKNLGEVDSGNYTTLENTTIFIKNFLQKCKVSYQNIPFYLIIWDHGDGWFYYPKNKAIAMDVSSYNDKININELVKALNYINTNFHSINLLGFDACFMGNLETLYDIFINNITKYIVASEFNEPLEGWNYNITFDNISNPYLVGKNFVDGYEYYYTHISPASYSLALYLQNNTLNYIQYINQSSINLISTEPTSFNIARNYFLKYEIGTCLTDSYLFLNNTAKDLNFNFQYDNFPTYLRTNLSYIKGASISFPADGWFSYFKKYYLNSTINPFGKTNYGKFISDYIDYENH